MAEKINSKQLFLDQFVAYHVAENSNLTPLLEGLTVDDVEMPSGISIGYDPTRNGNKGVNTVYDFKAVDGTWVAGTQTFTPADILDPKIVDDTLNPNYGNTYASLDALKLAISTREITELGIYYYYDEDGETVLRAGLTPDNSEETAQLIVEKIKEYLKYELTGYGYEYHYAEGSDLQFVVIGECMAGIVKFFLIEGATIELPAANIGQL